VGHWVIWWCGGLMVWSPGQLVIWGALVMSDE
jgi:hypothetical protein